jgi:formate dehydrogenase major subunit
MRQTALNLLLSEHTGDCEAPCTVACPAHANVEEYVQAGKRGDFLEALKIIKKRIPLPMTIGRVCPRFCEKNCRKNITGSPVAINDFKRLAADLFYDTYMEELPEETGKKAAVVGGGPAGTSAAYFLRLKGIDVTVFEAMPKAGGMTRYGIPEYRLPKAILDRELAHLEKLGVKFVFGRKLGENLTLDEMNKSSDPYSTYSHDGLPPSAICNPGLDAIIAALYPNSSDSSGTNHVYYYMVAGADGYHYFAKTKSEHDQNVARAAAERGQ